MIKSCDKFQVLGHHVLMDVMTLKFLNHWAVQVSWLSNLLLMDVMSRHLLLYFSDLLAITVAINR